MQNEKIYEANTEPIPRHPESLSLAAIRRKMAEVAMERRSPFDEKQTESIRVVDESEGQESIDVTHTRVVASGKETPKQAKQTPEWIKTIDRVNGR